MTERDFNPTDPSQTTTDANLTDADRARQQLISQGYDHNGLVELRLIFSATKTISPPPMFNPETMTCSLESIDGRPNSCPNNPLRKPSRHIKEICESCPEKPVQSTRRDLPQIYIAFRTALRQGQQR